MDDAKSARRAQIRDGKRIETANARRMLPVVGGLARIGFMQYVERRRGSNDAQLFTGERPEIRGKWGDGSGEWFLRLLRSLGIEGTKLGTHSFRHNFEDRLRQAELHGTAIGAELAGRSKAGNSGETYGKGFSVAQLAEAMRKVRYPDLDLSHIRWTPPARTER